MIEHCQVRARIGALGYTTRGCSADNTHSEGDWDDPTAHLDATALVKALKLSATGMENLLLLSHRDASLAVT